MLTVLRRGKRAQGAERLALRCPPFKGKEEHEALCTRSQRDIRVRERTEVLGWRLKFITFKIPSNLLTFFKFQ